MLDCTHTHTQNSNKNSNNKKRKTQRTRQQHTITMMETITKGSIHSVYNPFNQQQQKRETTSKSARESFTLRTRHTQTIHQKSNRVNYDVRLKNQNIRQQRYTRNATTTKCMCSFPSILPTEHCCFTSLLWDGILASCANDGFNHILFTAKLEKIYIIDIVLA